MTGLLTENAHKTQILILSNFGRLYRFRPRAILGTVEAIADGLDYGKIGQNIL
ncbi:hypothetical protein CKA32_003142 [Geitlerinema sp. FC II]|nr:hypothetical protein CKA32_003142 [Geitlerinema sp. FC II]